MRDLNSINRFLNLSQPVDIANWACEVARRPVLFTNFRPSSIALIHLLTSIDREIPVVWIDSGFNTTETYRYSDSVIRRFGLNVIHYTPKITQARWLSLHGEIPELDSKLHEEFTFHVKLEPFKRAMRELKPDLWFTGARRDQSEFRKTMDAVSPGPNDSLKIAPFIDWNEKKVDQYIAENNLPVYFDYLDPTKGPAHRECGLQLLA